MLLESLINALLVGAGITAGWFGVSAIQRYLAQRGNRD